MDQDSSSSLSSLSSSKDAKRKKSSSTLSRNDPVSSSNEAHTVAHTTESTTVTSQTQKSRSNSTTTLQTSQLTTTPSHASGQTRLAATRQLGGKGTVRRKVRKSVTHLNPEHASANSEQMRSFFSRFEFADCGHVDRVTFFEDTGRVMSIDRPRLMANTKSHFYCFHTPLVQSATSKPRKTSKTKLTDPQPQSTSQPPQIKIFSASELLGTLENIQEEKNIIKNRARVDGENVEAAMNHLSRLNDNRQNILELCGSDAQPFLKSLLGKAAKRSQLISSDVASSGLEHSKLSSDSIPDLVNTDFEAVSNLSRIRIDDQQLVSSQSNQQQGGLETSSSFEKYSIVEEATTTPNEESTMTSESVDTSRNFIPAVEKPLKTKEERQTNSTSNLGEKSSRLNDPGYEKSVKNLRKTKTTEELRDSAFSQEDFSSVSTTKHELTKQTSIKSKRKKLTKSRTTERLIQSQEKITSLASLSTPAKTKKTKKIQKTLSSTQSIVESSSSSSSTSLTTQKKLAKSKKHAKSMEIESNKLTAMNVETSHDSDQKKELRELRNFAFLRFTPPTKKKQPKSDRKIDKEKSLKKSPSFEMASTASAKSSATSSLASLMKSSRNDKDRDKETKAKRTPQDTETAKSTTTSTQKLKKRKKSTSSKHLTETIDESNERVKLLTSSESIHSTSTLTTSTTTMITTSSQYNYSSNEGASTSLSMPNISSTSTLKTQSKTEIPAESKTKKKAKKPAKHGPQTNPKLDLKPVEESVSKSKILINKDDNYQQQQIDNQTSIDSSYHVLEQQQQIQKHSTPFSKTDDYAIVASSASALVATETVFDSARETNTEIETTSENAIEIQIETRNPGFSIDLADSSRFVKTITLKISRG